MNVLDVLSQANGFESAEEMNRMIASVPMGKPGVLAKFSRWKLQDGSREGLQLLLDQQRRKDDGLPE